jgi:hypothetical protein
MLVDELVHLGQCTVYPNAAHPLFELLVLF